jgi:hypothetical protein
MRAYGLSPLLTHFEGNEQHSWDAALALALYEEGERQRLIRVGEPTNGAAFFALVQDSVPTAEVETAARRPRRAGRMRGAGSAVRSALARR